MKNNKGYILTETLIVSAVVLTTLVLIYSQFAKINKNYGASYDYNSINGIYALNNIVHYINEENNSALTAIAGQNAYTDITSCDSGYYTYTSYCKKLLEGSNIKTLLITTYSKLNIIGALSNDNAYGLDMQNFVKTLDDSSNSYNCRLVAQFNDGTYASIPIQKGTSRTIYATVLDAFPELEVGDSGCKVADSTKNYTYMGGCYLKGAQTKNYLWYSGFLWRIMGINSDNTVKLITEENVTAISYNTSGNSNFDGSHEDSWLNDYFYSRLRGSNIITTSNFCQGAVVTTVPSRTDCTGGTVLSKNVGLISIDEYDLASSSSSYLVNSQYFWTMSPYSTSDAWDANKDGSSSSSGAGIMHGARPVINVNSTSSITSGDGTLSSIWSSTSSPYILSENKTTAVTGSIADKVTSGEYVKLSGKTYRVVNKETNGVKLILDGYYKC